MRAKRAGEGIGSLLAAVAIYGLGRDLVGLTANPPGATLPSPVGGGAPAPPGGQTPASAPSQPPDVAYHPPSGSTYVLKYRIGDTLRWNEYLYTIVEIRGADPPENSIYFVNRSGGPFGTATEWFAATSLDNNPAFTLAYHYDNG